ncbi:MAG TPA: homoserine dehydrogenase, partial [Pelagibacterium sp.]|nr:homoserine dehydrogenase [Pelagibacterium sp.]
PKLRALARSSGAMLKLSGAAAAALPTIDLLEHSLKGSTVLEIEGIVNATTNYLLDAMMNLNLGLEDALARA